MASSSSQDQHIDIVGEDIELEDHPSSTVKEDLRNKYECTEDFDIEREVFRTQVPGALELERENLVNLPYKKQGHRFKTELEPEDVRLVNELGQLSADQLMEYLRKIKDMACGLGQVQEDQCLRGKFMGVFKQQ